MKKFTRLVSLAVIGAGLLASLPAKADVYFRDNDRVVLRSYVTSLPAPTTSVTYYNPGTILPDTVTYNEVPTTVVSQLPPPPSGDVYVTVGRNAYLINRQTRTIIDAEKLED